jgi:hypothetical protein
MSTSLNLNGKAVSAKSVGLHQEVIMTRAAVEQTRRKN